MGCNEGGHSEVRRCVVVVVVVVGEVEEIWEESPGEGCGWIGWNGWMDGRIEMPGDECQQRKRSLAGGWRRRMGGRMGEGWSSRLALPRSLGGSTKLPAPASRYRMPVKCT